MPGLKFFLPTLAECVNRSPKALNEWMRALLAEDLLKGRPGRGPGSGVDLSSTSLATMILAIMASDFRSAAVENTKVLVRGNHGRSKLTGAINPRDALARSLELDPNSRGVSSRIVEVSLLRDFNIVELRWQTAEMTTTGERFCPPGVNRSILDSHKVVPDGLSTKLVLAGPKLDVIVTSFRKLVLEGGETGS